MKKISLIILMAGFTAFSFAQDNKPKATYRVGKAKVTVWENEETGKYGDYTEKNFRVEKIYKKDDKWEITNYFNLAELLQLRAAIDKAISEEAVETRELNLEE